MDGLPRSVETPPPMDTTIHIMGIDITRLAGGGVVALVGVLMALAFRNVFPLIPFIILGVFVVIYERDGLPVYDYLWRKLTFRLFEPPFKEGRDECAGYLMNVTDVYEDHYRVGANRYVALLLVRGIPFDSLSRNQRMAVLGGYRSLLNSSSFDFPIQITGSKGKLPMYRIRPSTGGVDHNPAIKHIGEELSAHLDSIYESHEIYYYHIAVPYHSREEGSSRRIRDDIESTLDRRVALLSQHLSGMGLAHTRLSGESLINTLRAFMNEEEVIGRGG